jgi:hypothetical protein
MNSKWLRPLLILVVFLIVPGLALSQATQQSQTLSVNGQPGQVKVIQVDGRSYVDLEALARVANGSLSFNGNQITLTLPGSGTSSPAASSQPSAPATPGFSKGFMRAGIEEMSVIREWRSGMINSIQNNYPITESWVANFRGQASTNLRLAFVAISTESDRNAYELLSNELENMKKLSDQLLAARKSMTYVSADDLQNDPLNQGILACARSLASMAATGQFVDGGTCH